MRTSLLSANSCSTKCSIPTNFSRDSVQTKEEPRVGLRVGMRRTQLLHTKPQLEGVGNFLNQPNIKLNKQNNFRDFCDVTCRQTEGQT